MPIPPAPSPDAPDRPPAGLHALLRRMVLLPLLALALGSLGLLKLYWDNTRAEAEAQLARDASALAELVSGRLAVARSRLETLAASPRIDEGDWDTLHRYVRRVVVREPGGLITLVDNHGQQLLNTSVERGVPLPNVWALAAQNRTTEWLGGQLPVSSQGLTREVIERRRAGYSSLYIGLNTQLPTLAMSVPVLREGRATHALTLSFPSNELEAMLLQRPLEPHAHWMLTDREGRVVAASPGAGTPVGTRLPLPAGAAVVADGDTLRAVVPIADTGLLMRVVQPLDVALAGARLGLASWSALLALVFAALLWTAGRLSRRLAQPLRALSDSARLVRNRDVPAPVASGVRELDELAATLREAALREQALREQERQAAAQAAQARERAASADRLQRVLDSLFAYVSVLDLDGRVVETNRAPLEAAGLRRGDVLGQPLAALPVWRDDPTVRARLQQGVAQAAAGQTLRLDVPMRGRGDEWATVDFQLAPLRDADGRITHVVASGVDVSGRIAALARARESEQRFRRMADGLPVMVWVRDADGRLEFVNGTYRRFFDLPDSALDLAGWRVQMHPQDGPAYLAEFNRCRLAQEPFHATLRVRGADGRWRRVESWAQPRFDDDGSYRGHIGGSVDVTDTQAARVAADREAEMRQLALDAARLGWWHFDPVAGSGRGDARAFEILGMPGPEAHVRDFEARLHPEDVALLRSRVAALLRSSGPQSFHVELRAPQPDGTLRWMEIFGQIAHDREETPPRPMMLGTVADVTERHATQEALREADRRKDEFLAVLAHELRNPLGPVRNAVEILKRVDARSPAGERSRGIIERQVQHMARLIDDLMDVSRIVHGRIRLDRERTDLVELVHQAVDNERESFERAGIALALALPAAPMLVDGDRTRLAQMVGNLLHNAVKFTPRGGHVAVTLAPEDGGRMLALTVADDGVGIEPALLPTLFDPFVQAEQPLARTRGGLGLGLALVRGLAVLHGGSASAESEGPGRGARLVVRLPKAEAELPRAVPPAAAPRAAVARRRVLLVEDNPDALDSLRTLMTTAGHQVDAAQDGEAALALAAAARHDAVVCDVGLPGALDGYALARRLRERAGHAPAQYIAVSGYAPRRAGEDAGVFDHYLVKPVDPQALLALLAQRGTATAVAA